MNVWRGSESTADISKYPFYLVGCLFGSVLEGQQFSASCTSVLKELGEIVSNCLAKWSPKSFYWFLRGRQVPITDQGLILWGAELMSRLERISLGSQTPTWKLGIAIFTTFKFPFLPTTALQTCYEQSNNSTHLLSVLQGTGEVVLNFTLA